MQYSLTIHTFLIVFHHQRSLVNRKHFFQSFFWIRAKLHIVFIYFNLLLFKFYSHFR